MSSDTSASDIKLQECERISNSLRNEVKELREQVIAHCTVAKEKDRTPLNKTFFLRESVQALLRRIEKLEDRYKTEISTLQDKVAVLTLAYESNKRQLCNLDWPLDFDPSQSTCWLYPTSDTEMSQNVEN